MRVACLHTCQQSVKLRVSKLTVRVVKLYAAFIAYITYVVHGSILPDKPHAVADNGKITYTMMTNLLASLYTIEIPHTVLYSKMPHTVLYIKMMTHSAIQ